VLALPPTPPPRGATGRPPPRVGAALDGHGHAPGSSPWKTCPKEPSPRRTAEVSRGSAQLAQGGSAAAQALAPAVRVRVGAGCRRMRHAVHAHAAAITAAPTAMAAQRPGGRATAAAQGGGEGGGRWARGGAGGRGGGRGGGEKQERQKAGQKGAHQGAAGGHKGTARALRGALEGARVQEEVLQRKGLEARGERPTECIPMKVRYCRLCIAVTASGKGPRKEQKERSRRVS